MHLRRATTVSKFALAVALATAVPRQAPAQLFYNGDLHAGPAFIGTHVNHPTAPNVVMFDNFRVPAGQTWAPSAVFGHFLADQITPPITTLSWQIRTGMVPGGSTGTLFAAGSGPFAQVGTRYTVPVLVPFVLGPGDYWLGVYADLTGAAPVPGCLICPFFGVAVTSGFASVNAVLDNRSLALIGADDFLAGGTTLDEARDMSLGLLGRVATVPEPGTWALLGTGLLSLGGVAARRRRGSAG